MGIPCAGPICSARSSLVRIGFPTTRSSMFISNSLHWTLRQEIQDPRTELRSESCLSRHTITLQGLQSKIDVGANNESTPNVSNPDTFIRVQPIRRLRADCRLLRNDRRRPGGRVASFP